MVPLLLFIYHIKVYINTKFIKGRIIMNETKIIEALPNIIEKLNGNFIFLRDDRKKVDLFYMPNIDEEGFMLYFSQYNTDERLNLNSTVLPDMDNKIPENSYHIIYEPNSNKFIAKQKTESYIALKKAFEQLQLIGIEMIWRDDEIDAIIDFLVTALNAI